MDIKDRFQTAVSDSKLLSQKPDNETLLLLYALYKQATEGDNAGDPPTNPFDFVNKAKFEAWLAQKGKSAETAMLEYTELVTRLKG